MIFLPGAFNHYEQLLLLLLKEVKNLNFFKEHKQELVFYDGVDNSKWNGGKPNYLSPSTFSEKKLRSLNKLSIGVYLTYSNFYITDYSLKHENDILTVMNESPLNGVIVSDLKFADYIREKYKNLKLSLSVTYFKDYDLDNYNFKELEDQFHIICPMYPWVFKEEFIKRINPKKYKIMLNDTCKVNCPVWHKHFSMINKAIVDDIQDLDELKSVYHCLIADDVNCPQNGWAKDRAKYGEYLGMDIETPGIKKLLEIGYTSFKLNGRDHAKDIFNIDIGDNLRNIINALKLS